MCRDWCDVRSRNKRKLCHATNSHECDSREGTYIWSWSLASMSDGKWEMKIENDKCIVSESRELCLLSLHSLTFKMKYIHHIVSLCVDSFDTHISNKFDRNISQVANKWFIWFSSHCSCCWQCVAWFFFLFANYIYTHIAKIQRHALMSTHSSQQCEMNESIPMWIATTEESHLNFVVKVSLSVVKFTIAYKVCWLPGLAHTHTTKLRLNSINIAAIVATARFYYWAAIDA